MKIFIHGLNSCGMRNVELQRYRDFLVANGHELVNHPAHSEKILLWTCAFRRDVRDNSLSEITRYIREYGDKLAVAGCLPDIDQEMLNKHFHGQVINWRDDEKRMAELFGAPNKKLTEIPRVLFKGQLYENETAFKKENPYADVPYIGRFIQLYVSEGCNFECTYCAERLAFPPYRSYPEDEILEACSREVERSGKTAVVLLADSVGDYGCDTGSNLPTLIRRLQQVRPDLKIGLQGFNPSHFLKFYDEIVEFLRSGLIAHLQIPFQSASDRILELMKRAYNRADIDKVYGTLNEIGFTEFDTHIIVGFNGETEEDFEETLQFTLRHHPKYVLVNGFMESPKMAAAKLPGKVDQATKQRWLKEAEARIKAAGILCNCDDGEFSASRFRRINRIS